MSLRRLMNTVKADLRGTAENIQDQNIRLNNYHGIVSSIASNMIMPFIGIFAVRLGASNYEVGLVSSAPAFVSLLAMIPGAKFVDSQGNKKGLTATFMLANRIFYLLLALIPFFTTDRRALILVVTLALMSLPGAISNVAWQGFIASVVPRERRAVAFAERSRIMNIIGTLAVLAVGRILDIFTYPLGYQVIFAVAFAFALLEIWVFRQLREDPQSTEEAAARNMPLAQFAKGFFGSVAKDVREIITKKSFRRFALVSLFFHFAWQVAWPLFTLYQTKELGANNLWISILHLSNTGGSLLGYGFWAKYMNKHGSLKTLFVSTSGMFIVPTVYAFSRSLYTITFFNVFIGVIFSGVMLSLFNALLDMTPEERKTTYIGYYNTAINASAIFAPMAGVALLQLFGYRNAFLITALLRTLGSLAFGAVYLLENNLRLISLGRKSV